MKYSSGSTDITTIGFVNVNNQMNTGTQGKWASEHSNQKVYRMICNNCEHLYGANGFDIHLRKCPNCGGGAKGLEWRK